MASNVAKHEGSDDTKPRNPIAKFRSDVEAMKPQFALVLPPGMSADRFARVGITAYNNNKRLRECDPQSVIVALMQAAQDQLLPDGKQGAIIPYEEDGRLIARWAPMTAGIRAKIRASGALADLNVQCVYEGDEFDFQLGDDPFIHHKPSMHGGRTRKVVAAYSIATYPDGTKSREVMNGDMIEDIRKKSKSKRGPWSDPVFYGEMARKTVTRLHSKQLPMSTDLEITLSRNDDMYDLTSPVDEPARPRIKPPGSARAVLDHFAQGGAPEPAPAPAPRDDDVPTIEGEVLPSPGTQPDAEPQGSGEPQEQPKPPTTEAEYRAFAEAHIDAATGDPRDLHEWWSSAAQRKLRNACAVVKETFDALAAKVKDKCAALEGAS